MSQQATIKASKKNHQSVHAAVQAVQVTHATAVQHLGGVLVLTNTILAVITQSATVTVAQAAQRVEQALAKLIPAVIVFLANTVGGPEKDAIRKILEKLT